MERPIHRAFRAAENGTDVGTMHSINAATNVEFKATATCMREGTNSTETVVAAVWLVQ